MRKKLSTIDIIAKEFFPTKEIICDRCAKETNNWSGTPNFRICKDCFNELENKREE